MGYDLHVCDGAGDTLETDYEDDLYFRRNMFGMGPLRDQLEMVSDGQMTMGYWSRSEPPFPRGGNDDDVIAWLRATGDERPGIPLHKLCSNDGWWVTGAECRSALDIWERAGSPMPEEFRDDWIPFLQAAAKNGGFRTY